jgi:uncharacterized protein YdiU (UPF0061 family)
MPILVCKDKHYFLYCKIFEQRMQRKLVFDSAESQENSLMGQILHMIIYKINDIACVFPFLSPSHTHTTSTWHRWGHKRDDDGSVF